MTIRTDYSTNNILSIAWLPNQYTQLYYNLVKKTIHLCDNIVIYTISENSKKKIEKILNISNEKIKIIVTNLDTKWIRDYHPINLRNNQYIGFNYKAKRINDSAFLPNNSIIKNNINLRIDGGDMIVSKDLILMSKNILTKNNLNKKQFLNEFNNVFDNNIIFLDTFSNDKTKHMDLYFRFIDNDTILTIYYNDIPSLNSVIQKNLKKIQCFKKYKILELDVDKEICNYFLENNIFLSYLNFININNNIIFPLYGYPSDRVVKMKLKSIFQKEVIGISCFKLLHDGGGLHCITYN